jgi:hypothetical protein
MTVSDFISHWGKVRIEIQYGTIIYKKSFDRESINSMLAADITGAADIVGVPHVTPKTP